MHFDEVVEGADFNPRFPRGKRLTPKMYKDSDENISIHASREGSDFQSHAPGEGSDISIHASREGSDPIFL